MSEIGTFALEMNGVKKQKGFQLPLKGVSMHVPAASIYGLVGPDRAGKRLLFEVAGHLTSITEGEILVSSIPDASPAHQHVGLYLQGSGMIPEYTLYQNFSRIGTYLNMKDRKEQIDEIFKLFGLRKYAKKRVSSMSPKTVHIAGIAMAFFGWPGLVLLEEPFKRLKGDEIESLKNILVTLKEERAIAIVVSCDKVKQVEDIADHYGVFIDGNIEAELALEEVNVFSQLEMHIRVDNPKKALAIMKAHGAFGRDGWLILPEPKLSTGEVFSMLMKKKIGVYEITTKKLEKVDYFNQFTERAKGNIYE